MQIFLYTENKKLLAALTRHAQAVQIPILQAVAAPIKGHFDIQCFVFEDNTLISCPQSFPFFKRMLPQYTVLCGQYNPSAPYPNDIAYNAALVGTRLFCNVKNTDPIILQQAQQRSIKIINVRQGYAKCSTIPVSQNALITSDPSIAQVAIHEGLDVLKVENEDILLPGYPVGFLGGCCCVHKDALYFCGDVTALKEYSRISSFAAKYDKSVISIPDIPLTDLGSPHIF